MRQEATEKSWSLKLTSMSHTPGTEKDAQRLSSIFQQEFKSLNAMMAFANGEELLDKEDDPYDGVMRVIED